MFHDGVNTIKKKTFYGKGGLVWKYKHIENQINFYTCHQYAGQHHYMNRANKFPKNVAEFKHTRITIEQSVICEEIKRNIYLGSACYP
jgi:hypothetical protein